MSGDSATSILPAFERLRYFHGQMLGARDFRAEQDYFREKLKLLTRCLGGYGVICGLEVVRTEPPDDCDPDDRPPPRLHVEPGVAVDCAGNVLIVGAPCPIVLDHLVGPEDRRRIERGEADQLYLSVCYCEKGIEPTRPLVSHSCATAESCEHARILESITFRASVDPPPADERCGTCCEPCGPTGHGECDGACLVLARIELELSGDPDRPIIVGAVHNEVRRMLSRHQPTTITGLNWWHGATYGVSAASSLARDGLVIELSAPVHTDSLRNGVVDVVVHQGGKGNVGGIYHVPGAIVTPVGMAMTDRIVWRADTDETFQNGDRVLVILRGDFVLDRCCRPIDAEHVGGRVPPSADAIEPVGHQPPVSCLSPPERPGPWRSGNGVPGGTFESWLYVTNETGATTS